MYATISHTSLTDGEPANVLAREISTVEEEGRYHQGSTTPLPQGQMHSSGDISPEITFLVSDRRYRPGLKLRGWVAHALSLHDQLLLCVSCRRCDPTGLPLLSSLEKKRESEPGAICGVTPSKVATTKLVWRPQYDLITCFEGGRQNISSKANFWSPQSLVKPQRLT